MNTFLVGVASALVLSLAACGGGGQKADGGPSVSTATNSASAPNSASTGASGPTASIGSTAPAVITLVAEGEKWSDPATWGGVLPKSGDAVQIPAGRKIVLDVDPPPLSGVLVQGVLTADATRDLTLRTDYLIVMGAGAEFRIGWDSQPYTKRALITLTAKGETAADRAVQTLGLGIGAKVLGATLGGRLALFGEARTGWVKLNQTAKSGDSTISVDAAASGWHAGDRIAVASTSLEYTEAEERSITAVSGNLLTLSQPLTFKHFGEVQSFAGSALPLDARGEVALLSRNITVQGDDRSVPTQFGGHVILNGPGSNATVSGIELTNMGQFNNLGRYPFHWHVVGEAKGGFIRNSVAHHNIQRGIVDHSTDNVLVEGNVVYSTFGHGFMVENGIEVGSVFKGNLAFSAKPALFTNATLAPQNDDKAAAYWIKSAKPIFLNNVAAGGPRAGFFFDSVADDGKGEMQFSGNAAHSYRAPDQPATGDPLAVAVWAKGFSNVRRVFTFDQMTVHNNQVGTWGETRNSMNFNNSVFADNFNGSIVDTHYKDSLIVGVSANNNVPPQPSYAWPSASAITDYNGTTSLENVTLVNHVLPAMRTAACRNEGQRFSSTKVTLVNAPKPFQLCGGDTQIADADGTLSGTGRPTWAVGTDSFAIRPSYDCVWNANLSANLCPKPVESGPLYIQRTSTAAMSVTRDDGVGTPGAMTNAFPQWVVTIGQSSYTLSAGLEAFDRFDAYGWGIADGVEVIMPTPNGNFALYRSLVDDGNCYGCGFGWSDARLKGGGALQRAPTLALFRAAPFATYFYDSAARTIRFRVGGSSGGNVYGERN